MLNKSAKFLFLLLFSGTLVLLTNSCSKKKIEELPEEYKPEELEIKGGWDKIVKDSNSIEILISTNTSIFFVRNDSYCIDSQTGNKVNIIDEFTEKKVFHRNSSGHKLKINILQNTANPSQFLLTNCQLGWKENSNRTGPVKVLAIKDNLNFDGIVPDVTISVPSSAAGGTVSFSDINSGNFGVTVTPNKKGVGIASSNCVDVNQFKAVELDPASGTKVKIDASKLKAPIQAEDTATTNCEIIFEDLTNRKIKKQFEITVLKPTFSASLDGNIYTYSKQGNNNGRAVLTAESSEEGSIACTTDIGRVDCLGGEIPIAKATEINQPLSSMHVGTDNYHFTYTPKGALPGSNWETKVSFGNIKFDASFDLIATLPVYGNTGSQVKKVYFDVPQIGLKITGAERGKVNFSAGTNSNCPDYPRDIEVEDGVSKDTPTENRGRSLSLDYLPDSETSLVCLVTMTITAPADLAGSEVTKTLSFKIDKKPPTVTVNQDPIEVGIDRAGVVTAEFTVSEEVVVDQDSCNNANKGAVLNANKTKLTYDFSAGSANSSCNVVFKDYTLDIVQSKTVSFNVSILAPQIFSFDGNSANGSSFFARQTGEANFTSDTTGYIFCENLAPDKDLVNGNKNCFESEYVIITVPAASNQTTSSFTLTNLSKGAHNYKFTLLPNPPYSPVDLAKATHKVEITQKIEANKNPLVFSATPTGKISGDKQDLSLTLSEAGNITYRANSGGECPDFDPPNILFSTGGTKKITMDYSKFSSSSLTVVDCTLTLSTLTVPSEDADATIIFNIDKERPVVSINDLASNVALPSDSIMNVNNFASTSRTLNVTMNISEEGTVFSRCLGKPNARGSEIFDAASGLNKSVEINFSGIPQSTTVSPQNPNNKVYTCIFDSQDKTGNAGDKYTLNIEYSSPEIIFTPQNPAIPSIEYTFPVASSPGVHIIEVASPVDAQKITCYTTRPPIQKCGEVPAAGNLSANVKQDIILSNLAVGLAQYKFELIDRDGAKVDTKLINITFSSDIGFKVYGPDIGDVLNEFNESSQIQYTTGVAGKLSISKQPGDMCFTLRNQSADFIGPFANKTNLLVDLPPSCNLQCTISCILIFKEKPQSGLNSQREASHTFNFSIDKRGIGLSDFAPNPGSIVDVGEVNLSVSFRVAVDLDAALSGDKITINKYQPHSEVLYTFDDGDLSFDNNNTRLKLDIKDRNLFVRNLLKTNRAYLRIPKNKIIPKSGSGLGFGGICQQGCDLGLDASNFYVAAKMSKIKDLGSWSIKPDTPTTLYNFKPEIVCGNQSKEYCIGTNGSSGLNGIKKLEIKKSSTAGNPAGPNINDSSKIGFDTNNNKVTLTHKGFKESGNYHIAYDYSPSATDSYSSISKNQLLTHNGAVIIGDTGELLSFEYRFAGITKMTSKKVAAAYGMRLLNADYNGPIMEVVVLDETQKNKDYSRETKYKINAYSFNTPEKTVPNYRSSSNTQQLVNVAGSLNLEELDAIVSNSANNKYLGVYKWYDQSGNNRHLEQFNDRGQTNLPIIWIKNTSDIRSYGDYNYYKLNNVKERRPAMLFIKNNYSNNIKNFSSPLLGNTNQQLWEYLGKNGSRNELEGTLISVATHNTSRQGSFAWGFSSDTSQLAETLDIYQSNILFANRNGKVYTTGGSGQTGNFKELALHASDVSLAKAGNNLKFDAVIHYLDRSKNLQKPRISFSPSSQIVRTDLDLNSNLYIGGYPENKAPGYRTSYRLFTNEAIEPGVAMSEIIIFKDILDDEEKEAVLGNQADYYIK